MIEGQALGKLAVLGAVGRADQAVELLPEVVLDLLGVDLGEQALLAQPPRIVTLQLGADFALALGQGFQLGSQQLQALFELFALEFAGRVGLQGGQLLVGGGFQRLGLGQGFVQALLELNQRTALLLVEQCGLEGALVAERAGGQGRRPLLRFFLQIVLILAQPLRLGLLGAVQLLLTAVLLAQLRLGLLQRGQRIGHRGQRRLLLLLQCRPALLPVAVQFAGNAEGVFQFALLTLPLLAPLLRLLPAVPLDFPFAQPGVTVGGQAVTESGQVFAEDAVAFAALALQLLDTGSEIRQLGVLILSLLTGQGQLLLPGDARLLELLTNRARAFMGALHLIEPIQATLDSIQFARLLLLMRGQGGGIGQRGAELFVQLLPALVLLSALLTAALQLLPMLFELAGQGRQLAGQTLTAGGQGFQFGLLRQQGLLGGGHVQRLVGGNRRVFVGATQGAGLALLQLRTVGFQGLDAPLLLQQFFLVAQLLLQVLVARAQGEHLGILGGVLAVQLAQLAVQLRLLFGQLLARAGQLLELAQQAAAPVQQLPVLARGASPAPAKRVIAQPLLLSFRPLLFKQARLLGAQLRGLLDQLSLQHLHGLGGLLLLAAELVDVHAQLQARRKLAAPCHQLLTEPSVWRLLGRGGLQMLALRGQLIVSVLPLAKQLLAVLVSLPQTLADALRGLLLRDLGLLQGLFSLAHGLLRLLPVAMNRLQFCRRLAGGQLRQLCLGGLPFVPGTLLGQRRAVLLALRLAQVIAPLALALQFGLLGIQAGVFGAQALGFELQLTTLLITQQLDACGARAQLVEGDLDLAGLFEHALGNLPVDIGAGQFLQQLGALVGARLEEGGETALGQQHGLGETLEIQAGEALGLAQLLVDLVGEDGAIGRRQFHLGRLQRTLGLVAGAALAREGAVARALDLEFDLGQAIAGVPGHQFVGAGRHAAHARRAVVQGQADGIEQGGLAGSGRPGDGEQAVVLERLGGEIDLPFALQRVEVLQAQAEDLHASPSRSSPTTWRYKASKGACCASSRVRSEEHTSELQS